MGKGLGGGIGNQSWSRNKRNKGTKVSTRLATSFQLSLHLNIRNKHLHSCNKRAV